MGLKVVSIGILLLILLISYCQAELTPPYFNLATGRRIYATATCGQDTEGPELYCRSVGVNAESEYIDHSVCDFCDTNVPAKSHPPLNAIDGTDSWWQSPPLSRGIKFNEVNMTISFEQEFHVAYLFIRMGNSPRPGIWTLEKSTDYGKTWTPWQHFSDTPANCETYFGKDTYKPITRDDDVICTTEYSKIVPLENGEIPVMLLNERPSSTNYFNSTVLQEWTRATNVRIRLLRTKNLLGHLRFVTGQDPTVLRHYFYSIKDISIGGRCICNGHAEACDVEDPKSPLRILACRCQHHTCGINCNECCPGFEQKKWRQNTNARPFNCEPCNCHGHSNECKYDEEVNRKELSLDIHGHYDGGGVCQNCQHNTVGINCNKCKPKYYRPKGKHWNETDVCSPCQCDFFFSTGHCEQETGNCECRAAFQPPSCDSCAYGYYGYPNCRECECNLNGTNGYHCEAASGQQCPCKINFAGAYCKQCAEGYYGFPECKACECNKIGSISNDCNMTTGECKCLTNFGGHNCERCKHGYFNYPTCSHCDCDDQGTESEICNKQSGQCICREGFGGPKCDQCLPGFLNYPICTSCNCSLKRGLFFNNQKAYVKLFEHFNVGTEMKISFDFRPRDPNGLLFSVHGKSSYAILELVDNTLFFTVKTDLKNIVTTNYKLPNNESFCDGKTRNVQAIKSQFVINIAVDFISSYPGVGGEGSKITKTNRPLFLGGHLNFPRLPGISGQKKGFKGCISNVSVNQRMLNITPEMVFGDIWHGFCPLN